MHSCCQSEAEGTSCSSWKNYRMYLTMTPTIPACHSITGYAALCRHQLKTWAPVDQSVHIKSFTYPQRQRSGIASAVMTAVTSMHITSTCTTGTTAKHIANQRHAWIHTETAALESLSCGEIDSNSSVSIQSIQTRTTIMLANQ